MRRTNGASVGDGARNSICHVPRADRRFYACGSVLRAFLPKRSARPHFYSRKRRYRAECLQPGDHRPAKNARVSDHFFILLPLKRARERQTSDLKQTEKTTARILLT